MESTLNIILDNFRRNILLQYIQVNFYKRNILVIVIATLAPTTK